MRLGDNPMEYATLATAVNIPTEPEFTEGEEFSLWDRDGFGFGDILDVINPLQHIPIVSNIYRELSGDDIGPLPRIAGGALFGGVVGAVVSLVNVIIENGSGKDIGEHAIAMIFDDEEIPPPPDPVVMIAKAREEPAQPVTAPKKVAKSASGPPVTLSSAQPEATEKSEPPAAIGPAAEIPETLSATPVGPPVVLVPLRQTATRIDGTQSKSAVSDKKIGAPVALATARRPETPGAKTEILRKTSQGHPANSLPAGYRVVPVWRQVPMEASIPSKAAQDETPISAAAGVTNNRPGLAGESAIPPGPWVADNMIEALEKYERMSQARTKPTTVDVHG